MDQKRLKSRVLSVLARSVLLAAAVAAAVIIGEIVVRVTGQAPQFRSLAVDQVDTVYKRSSNPILGFELKADYRNPDPGLRRAYTRTNSHGQRDAERTIAKPAGGQRVILLGDSIVEGHGVANMGNTISAQLERLYTDGKTEVLNFGVSGYCTRAEIELLEVKGLKFKPDVVVLIFTENDFQNFNLEAHPMAGSIDRPAVIEWLFKNSHLFRMLAVRFNLFQLGQPGDTAGNNSRAIGDDNVVKGLARLRALADEHGFDTLIAIWPRFDDVEIVDVHPMPGGRGELVIERLADMWSLPHVRLSHLFIRHHASLGDQVNPRRYYSLGDQIHPSATGAAVAAQLLHKLLGRPRATAHGAFKNDPAAVAAARALGVAKADSDRFIGSELLAAGQPQQALVYFERSVKNHPGDPEALKSLASTLLVVGRVDDAIDRLRDVLEIAPIDSQAHHNLGTALFEQGRLTEAMAHLEKAVEWNPDLAEAHFVLALCLRKAGRPIEANRHVRRAVLLKPPLKAAASEAGFAYDNVDEKTRSAP